MAKVRYREISPDFDKLASPKGEPTSRVSIGYENEVGEFYYFFVEDLIPYKNQARTIFSDEEIERLAETIKEHGIRQPLTILKSSIIQDKYEVVSGERRLRAAKIVGLKKVPCIVINDEKDADEISLIENIQRQDLHPMELARAINKLLENKPYGAKSELSRKLGLAKSQISELNSLLTLSLEVQEELLNKGVRGREHLRKILSLQIPFEQIQYINSLVRREEEQKPHKTQKALSKSIIRLSLVGGVLKVQSYSLNKISDKDREDVKRELLNLVDQLEKKGVRGREHLGSQSV